MTEGVSAAHGGALEPGLVTVLRERAQRNAERAYAPYSGIHVGAAVLTLAGGIYSACNVENCSYGLSVCAERNAVFQAVAVEGSGMRVRALALYSDDARVTTPCGACRQVLAEFGPAAVVLLPDGTQAGAADLLPGGFSLA